MSWDLAQDSVIAQVVADGFARRPYGGAARYSFAVSGGAVGSISLGLIIPERCVITNGIVVSNTAPTSGGSATIALGWSGATGAILAATAVADFANPVAVTLKANTAASERTLLLTVATAALTAGVITVGLEWFKYA